MNLLKRCLFAITMLLCLVMLNGCIMIPLSEYYDISPEKVESVQFYDLSTAEDRSNRFFETEEPVYTLPQEKTDAFLEDFSKLKFSDVLVITIAAIDPSFDYGDWVVRVNFTDGTYTFYSSGGYGETLNADNECISSTHLSCEEEALASLIEEYYSEEARQGAH